MDVFEAYSMLVNVFFISSHIRGAGIGKVRGYVLGEIIIIKGLFKIQTNMKIN